MRPPPAPGAAAPRRQRQHRGGRPQRRRRPEQAAERPRQAGEPQGQAQPFRVRQHRRQQAAVEAVRPGPPVAVLHIGPRMVDQLAVVDARGAGGGAGQARQAAVDMLDHLRRGLALALQHVLDQVDAPPRAVELVAQQHIGRAGGGAEAAADAFADFGLGGGDLRVGQLGGGEVGPHAPGPRRSTNTRCGSKAVRTRWARAVRAGGSGWKAGASQGASRRTRVA